MDKPPPSPPSPPATTATPAATATAATPASQSRPESSSQSQPPLFSPRKTTKRGHSLPSARPPSHSSPAGAPAGAPPKSKSSLSPPPPPDLKAWDVIAFNQDAEKAFLELAFYLLDDAPDGVSAFTLIQETAYRLDVSVETARRYVVKYSASQGPLRVRKGVVTLREPEYNPDEGA